MSLGLPGEFGRFRLVTMGRSFHWMDREQILTALDRMVDEDGGLVIANDSCLVRPTTTWQRAIEDIQRRFSWTLEQAIGYLYSSSLPLRQLLGDQRTDFEKRSPAHCSRSTRMGSSPNRSLWKCLRPPEDKAFGNLIHHSSQPTV